MPGTTATTCILLLTPITISLSQVGIPTPSTAVVGTMLIVLGYPLGRWIGLFGLRASARHLAVKVKGARRQRRAERVYWCLLATWAIAVFDVLATHTEWTVSGAGFVECNLLAGPLLGSCPSPWNWWVVTVYKLSLVSVVTGVLVVCSGRKVGEWGALISVAIHVHVAIMWARYYLCYAVLGAPYSLPDFLVAVFLAILPGVGLAALWIRKRARAKVGDGDGHGTGDESADRQADWIMY